MRSVSVIAMVFAAFALTAYPTPSYAYLDPGTGSLVMQTIIGALVAVSVGLGALRHKISMFFKKLSGKTEGVVPPVKGDR